MPSGKLVRLRLIINVTSLAARVLFIIGAVWMISTSASFDSKSTLTWLYVPLINARGAHRALVLLLSFKFNIEDWVVVILAAPIYLMLAGIAFMFLSFAVSVIRSAFV